MITKVTKVVLVSHSCPSGSDPCELFVQPQGFCERMTRDHFIGTCTACPWKGTGPHRTGLNAAGQRLEDEQVPLGFFM